jgi:hypothetical protein
MAAPCTEPWTVEDTWDWMDEAPASTHDLSVWSSSSLRRWHPTSSVPLVLTRHSSPILNKWWTRVINLSMFFIMLWSYYYFEVTSPALGSFLVIQCPWCSYMLSRLYRVKTFRSNLPTYLLIRKGWNSYWYSARMPYMVQWLQAHCTIANSPRVWQVSDLRLTHMIHAWQTRLLMARKWQIESP